MNLAASFLSASSCVWLCEVQNWISTGLAGAAVGAAVGGLGGSVGLAAGVVVGGGGLGASVGGARVGVECAVAVESATVVILRKV